MIIMIESLLNEQKTYFMTDQTKSYAFRLEMLKKLRTMIMSNGEAIEDALKKDLGKSSFEAYTTEVGFTLHSVNMAIKHLKGWMRKKRVRTPFYQLFTRSYLMPEPKGTVLIIGPYNYPFQLLIEPLIGAIAAGNTAILKPSEFPKATEALLEKLINETFDPAYIKLITGDYTVTSMLLDHPYDHIFFTGSTRVGQIVYEKAAKHLTPVTLELGGKSPTIIDQTASLKIAARRIVFGKFINAGQTCIAPDYIYVHETVKDAFLAILKETIDQFYPKDGSFGTIINERHFDRLTALIEPSKVAYGGQVDRESLHIPPIVLDNVTRADAVMKEEIFGPILPILTFQSIDDVIVNLKAHEKPLALYLFTKDKHVEQKVFGSLSFGGGAINDTLMHVSNPYLPFGGIGASGIGRYHGYYSFSTFSHMKGYVKKRLFADPPIAYPPYTKGKEALIRRVMR
jgi:aldehyde dehydrogenase (NAD+)